MTKKELQEEIDRLRSQLAEMEARLVLVEQSQVQYVPYPVYPQIPAPSLPGWWQVQPITTGDTIVMNHSRYMELDEPPTMGDC